MKNLRIAALAPLLVTATALSALTAFGSSGRAAQDSQDVAQRIGKLETRISALETANAELARRADETSTYLGRQAEAGKALVATLAEAESLGFAKGINFESREVLLAGLRAFYAAQQTGIPQPAPEPEEQAQASRVSDGR